ncbi:MAG: DUF1329 domain-containing protein [Desulfatitalea sp.]|nr:DUF1329 domain-containing protein [Desulfatitalea sp.]NNK00744.1 DUF1329 domain-containing protein [Desulfatitalea sp.]
MNTKRYLIIVISLISVLLSVNTAVFAGVSEEEAGKLKTILTPSGAEKAGNKEGTIPAWTGGIEKTEPRTTGEIPGVYTEDKVLFKITAANMDQYADKLNEGMKTLLKRNPDTFYLNVYPTRRSWAAPEWVYENTYKNAMSTTLAPCKVGTCPVEFFAGYPFPIPKTGEQVMFNHLYRWQVVGYDCNMETVAITTNGKAVTKGVAHNILQFPLYDTKNFTREKYIASDQVLRKLLVEFINPPIKVGEKLIARTHIDDGKSAQWLYMTGQRRMRRLPVACCDVPNPSSAGAMNFDETEGFFGRISLFDWKIIGKQEMYVPYNTNALWRVKTRDEAIHARHYNPELLRFELHRVWVVEATLKEGERHVQPRHRYYIDEDSWMILYGDRYDARDQLAKTIHTCPTLFPELPTLLSLAPSAFDLIRNVWVTFSYAGFGDKTMKFIDPKPDYIYQPTGSAGEGIR